MQPQSVIANKNESIEMAARPERRGNLNEIQHQDVIRSENGNIVDSIAAFFFPISYLICLIAYFATYM